MSRPIKILLVDDEEDILEFMSYDLSKEGYDVSKATSGKDAINKALKIVPDVIILDIMMPKMDGIEACTIMRENPQLKNSMIIFLTARNETFTQVSALDAGGDDFITKPVKSNVLKSRIKALMRRHPDFQDNAAEDLLYLGDMIIDKEKYRVTIKGQDITLAKKEFELLMLLTSRPGKVFQRAEILSQVWGREVIVGDRTIDVHIRKLREKLGKGYIKTLKGVGYKFKTP